GGEIPAQVALLVTFGSGLRKLEDLQELQDAGGISAAELFLGAGLAWSLAGLLHWNGTGGMWLAALGGLVLFLAAAPVFVHGAADQRLKERLASLRLRLSWKDYYASCDVV